MGLRRKKVIAIVVVLIVFSAIVYVAIMVRSPTIHPVTAAEKDYSGSYDYVTTYGSLVYVNKFSVSITRVVGNNVSFSYIQTEESNQTKERMMNNYSLAFDPSKSSTYASGSALPLFVANDLSSGNGSTVLSTGSSTQIVTADYEVSFVKGFTQVKFNISGGGSSGVLVTWYMIYNQTTGFLVNGYATIASGFTPFSTYNYTLTSFAY